MLPKVIWWFAKPVSYPSDGEITEGIASVDDRPLRVSPRQSFVSRAEIVRRDGGTKVLSDRIVVRITAERGQTFLVG